ncbi:hypothetical protein GMMP15_390034 [Candidatus Magnetomoraceae bacterium gMMP-15]
MFFSLISSFKIRKKAALEKPLNAKGAAIFVAIEKIFSMFPLINTNHQ